LPFLEPLPLYGCEDVGVEDGAMEGIKDGCEDGATEGIKDGAVEGIKDGCEDEEGIEDAVESSSPTIRGIIVASFLEPFFWLLGSSLRERDLDK
jgi:hypothetical protein